MKYCFSEIPRIYFSFPSAEIEPEMLSAVEEVQKTGELMSSAAREFASDPCSSAKRGNMVRNHSLLVVWSGQQKRSS